MWGLLDLVGVCDETYCGDVMSHLLPEVLPPHLPKYQRGYCLLRQQGDIFPCGSKRAFNSGSPCPGPNRLSHQCFPCVGLTDNHFCRVPENGVHGTIVDLLTRSLEYHTQGGVVNPPEHSSPAPMHTATAIPAKPHSCKEEIPCTQARSILYL